MRELYINSVLVDIDEKVQIALQYRSFLFQGISALQQNRSWTVSLPKTARNLGVIDHAHATDNATTFPYQSYTVEYWLNSFPIIKQGNAVLLRVTGERIEFLFTFGTVFDKIKALSQKKISEIANDTLTWNADIDFSDLSAGYGWANWYSFTNQDRTYTTHADVPYSVIHPVVTLEYLVGKIGTLTSLDFTTLLDALQATSLVHAIPLRNAEGIDTSITNEVDVEINAINASNELTYVPQTSIIRTIGFNKDVKINSAAYDKPARIKFYGTVYLDEEPVLEIYKNTTKIGEGSSVNLGDTYKFTFEINVDLTLTDIVSVIFNSTATLSTGYTSFVKVLDLIYPNRAMYMMDFPIAPNLPDMTCADFLFLCCQLSGVFPFVDNDDASAIRFASAAVLFDNIATARDWSAKIVKKTLQPSEGEDITFRIDGYAQRNLLKYKGDTTVNDGYLTVDNTTIQPDSVLVDLKLAAAKPFSEGDATIDYPLYDISVQSGVLIKNPIKQGDDVVCEILNIGGLNYAQFTDDLKFSEIVKTTAYEAYQTLIEQPRMIKERFYLSERDIADLDLEKPIYIGQYGKYYAIITAQVKESGETECEMLEIKL